MNNKIRKLSLDLKEYFNDTAEIIAAKTDFIKRKRKLTGASFVKAMIFGHLEDGQCTIENLCERRNHYYEARYGF